MSRIKIKISSNFMSFDNVIAALLFLITFLHFVIVIAIFKWPPPGDIFNHGLFVSILVYNQKMTFTLTPYAPSVPSIPMMSGLHILAATLSMLSGIFPGEAVFIVGGAIVILIPLMMYSLTFILTRSKVLSIFTFFSVFLIGSNLEEWVIGYFYNGPYPSLFGFLAILLFLVYPVASSEIQAEENLSIRNRLVTLVIILGILLVYPTFVVFPVLYLLISMLYEGKVIKIFRSVTMKRKTVLLLLFSLVIAITLVTFFIIIFREALFNILYGINFYFSRVYGRPSYAVPISTFYTGTVGIAILVAGIISIIFVIRHYRTRLAVFYLVVFVPIILSLHPFLYPIFSLILPKRSLMLCSILSWVLFSVVLDYVFADFRSVNVHFGFKDFNQINLSKIVVVALIISLVFAPSLFSNFSFEQAKKYSWLTRHGFANDYDVLLWIHENIQPDELILNDYSYTSRYLLSFSVKNVTAKYHFNSEYERNRAIEAQGFWRDPTNITLFLRLVEKYNISYVLLTSEWGYHNWVGISGDNKYVSKPFTPSEYKRILDNHPYLELMFEKGVASVYRVKKIEEIAQISITYNISADRWKIYGSEESNVNQIMLSNDENEKIGNYSSLRIEARGKTKDMVVIHLDISAENWTQFDLVTFYWYGANTGSQINFSIEGPTENDRIEWTLIDNWNGWKKIILWIQFPPHRYGNPSLSNVIGISIEFAIERPVTWYLDELTIINIL